MDYAGKGKNYMTGTLHGGEGKDELKHESYETMGVHKSAPNPKLTITGDMKDTKPTGTDDSFDPMAAGYVSPVRKDLATGGMVIRSNQDIKNTV